MIYKSLDEIPIGRFIDVYMGDFKALTTGGTTHDMDELKNKATELIYEYAGIVKGQRQLLALQEKDDVLNLRAKVYLLRMSISLSEVNGSGQAANDALKLLGYSVDDQTLSVDKAKRVLGGLEFRLDALENTINNEQTEGDKIDRAYFTREMAMVMKHNKFTFNPQEVTAAMYAYWVKDMIDYYNLKNRDAE